MNRQVVVDPHGRIVGVADIERLRVYGHVAANLIQRLLGPALYVLPVIQEQSGRNWSAAK
jgi:hypothetical protein